ncbi:MAG: 30S ribosomal protein S6 [Ignavibacteria bacterium]|nr:30S ribosomal protein S6 [Ignavibacteria bacterium]
MIKKYYESYLIIDGNLDDAAIEDVIKKYEALFLKNEIDIKNTDRIGRKRLAYQIKKRLNGYYVCFEMMASPQLISKLERTYFLDENILRYLTIYMSPKSLKEKDEHLKNKAIIQSKFEESKNLAALEAEKAESAAAAAETVLETTKN